MNYQTQQLNTWPRAEHFKFYKDAVHPWFNICSNINVSKLYCYCKQQGYSFFHAYLYLTQQAINSNEAFHYRIIGDEVRLYRNISISIAILADDEMMRFCNLIYATPFSEFTQLASKMEKTVKSQPFIAANFVGGDMRQDVVHMSVLPWFSFTSFSHARNTRLVDSIPKVAFGKFTRQGSSMLMPFSVEVHHGVMDGLHVSRFVDTLQEMFDCPALLDS